MPRVLITSKPKFAVGHFTLPWHLVSPSYWSRKFGHIREVAFGKREK